LPEIAEKGGISWESVKKITLIYNGFHGLRVISFLVPTDAKPGDEVEVSPAVARRLNDEVCGISDCQCGEHIAYPLGWGDDRWAVKLPEGDEIRGNYPQD